MTPEPVVKEIDLCGQICPSSLLIALREVNKAKDDLKSNKTLLAILTDNRSSITHITDAVSAMGYCVETLKEEQHYRILIRRVA